MCTHVKKKVLPLSLLSFYILENNKKKIGSRFKKCVNTKSGELQTFTYCIVLLFIKKKTEGKCRSSVQKTKDSPHCFY